MSKKLIRVEGFKGGNDQYGSTGIRFALVKLEGEVRKQVMDVAGCREYLNTATGSLIRNGLDTAKLRLLLVKGLNGGESVKDVRDKMFTGKRIINLLEEEAGWPLSKITTVKHSVHSNAWLLTAPAQWISQPQLLSACALILRAATNYGPFEVNSLEQVSKTFSRVQKEKPGASDVHRLESCFRSLRVMVKNYDKIFGGIDIKKAWPDGVDGFGVYSGISSFTTETVHYSKEAALAQEKMRKLTREAALAQERTRKLAAV